MKKNYLTLALLTASLYGHGQSASDTSYRKQRISRVQVQTLFSYYTQNGDHSAITGGIGTEYLHVYAPQFTITSQPDSVNSAQLNMGVDVITSASMDNIDFVPSSASRVSARFYFTQGFSRVFQRSRLKASASSGMSLEAAYFSIPATLSLGRISKSGNSEWNIALQCFFDDLRWGRLNPDYGKPVKLIYPAELRYKEWFHIYRRYSYNLELAFYQVINEKMQLALFPGLVLQQGLLSTPYHRVYFNDGSEKVENLPTERWKIPLAAQLNLFASPRIILRTYYRFYWDNFGITAHTGQVEMPVKLSSKITLSPMFRFYTQSGSAYFKPYKQHDVNETFYSSNYELSQLRSSKIGVTFRYTPGTVLAHRYIFDVLEAHYAYYKRSDGLSGQMLSLLLELGQARIHQSPSSQFR